ncbi:ec911ed2-472e-41a6-9e42-38930c00028f-CDS [Sclerotinia trifoliorum]|uniref:Ec911ed2-472e-41a6-9e42-38930c00028f-CDS n=1 Tax=Sclerotinia trifoliorum TaxID=28548 RepID=A0A8H2ZTA2_9HELO|nr:ec911ed2-472e-41a6-9e42-38930c00028f-CDS [Sclerotinia trifoliorum]
MLPTPDTSHVSFDRIYEPAEDSFLLLDALSSASEKKFLQQRFPQNEQPSISPSPFVVEIGTGSGVVLSFVHAHARIIFGRADILTAGVDVNRYACQATQETVKVAEREQNSQGLSHGSYLGNVVGNLGTCLKPGMVDVLIFNPPYVPSPDVPIPELSGAGNEDGTLTYEGDSKLLALSYAGGVDGMEITDRLIDTLPEVLNKERGCAYILLCAQNKPEDVKQRIRGFGDEWKAETVSNSGRVGGWEKLQIVRIWRMPPNAS